MPTDDLDGGWLDLFLSRDGRQDVGDGKVDPKALRRILGNWIGGVQEGTGKPPAP